MNGYAESMSLYEQSLEAAGTAQSKFNLYLESNQATLDKFRSTLEGLWTTIIDSNSLMSIVKGATNFIEVLDSMVQKFGVMGSILNIVVPLIGVKLVWAIRSAYIEMLKLQATGSMTALAPTASALKQIISQFLGIKTAAGGATIAMGGLTLATAGLTLGLGLLTYGVMKWAQKSREAKEAFASALDNSQKINDEVKTLEGLAKKQEELSKIENKSVEQKQELIKVQRELAQLYPELATGIDAEGNKIADNLKLTKQLTEEKRKLLEQELLVIKTTADQKLPQLRKELADIQEEADEIQKRLTSGDTTEIRYNQNGMPRQVDITEKLKNRLLELINTQKEHHEEIAKLEDGVKSYNEILEENIERQKWLKAEELERQSLNIKSEGQYYQIKKALQELGFTSDEVSKIMAGNLSEVKEKYKELDIQQIINLQTIETLDATQKQTMMNMLESSKQATRQLIEDTKARIKAIMAEAQALAALTGGKVKNATAVSKKQEIDPKNGLLSVLSAQAQNEAIDAQRELVNLEGNLKEIEKALNNVSSIDTKQISGIRDPKKEKKDNRQFLESIDAEIRAIKLKNDNLIKTRDLLEEQLKIAKDIEGMEGLNKQYEITGQIIEHNKKMLESFKVEQDLVHKRANEIRKQHSKYNIDSWFDSNAEQTTTYIEQYNKATKAQQEEMDKIFNQIQKLKKAWMESATEVEKIVDANKQLVIEQDKLIEQQRELARQDWIKKQNDLYEDQQKRLSALEQIQEKIVAIIRKRGEEEKKALDEAYRADIDALEKRHTERKKTYADDLDEFKKMIQAKINALDEQYEEEDYLEQLNKEREEANRLQREIDVLSLDDSLTARNKVIELRQKLADQNEKIAKRQQNRERDLLKRSLQDQLKNREQDAKDKEDIANKTYENDKKRLEEDYRINKEFLDKKYSDEQVYAEARESIMRGQVEVAEGVFMDIYDAFSDFEDKFGRGMGILGDIIKRDFLDQLSLAQDAIKEMDYLAENTRRKYDSDYQPTDDEMGYNNPRGDRGGSGGSSRGGGKLSDMSRSDYYKYIQMKQLWEMARASNDKASEDYAHKEAQRLRDKYGIASDLYSYNQLKDIPYEELKIKGYTRGGKIDYTGLAMVHGEDNPEWMLRDHQLQKIISDSVLSTIKVAIPKIPNTVARQGVVLNIDNFIKADSITKDSLPMLQKFESDAMSRLKNELNKFGVRPARV